MAVKTREELMRSLRERLGDDTSDETLALLEDIDDTLGDTTQVEELRRQLTETDRTWREKYRNRFFSGGETKDDDPTPEDDEPQQKTYSYENLFKEEVK